MITIEEITREILQKKKKNSNMKSELVYTEYFSSGINYFISSLYTLSGQKYFNTLSL